MNEQSRENPYLVELHQSDERKALTARRGGIALLLLNACGYIILGGLAIVIGLFVGIEIILAGLLSVFLGIFAWYCGWKCRVGNCSVKTLWIWFSLTTAVHVFTLITALREGAEIAGCFFPIAAILLAFAALKSARDSFDT